MAPPLMLEKYSLVLSGGGIWGAAHIGVIKYLEEKDIVPVEIIGTSIGSLLGALLAFGHTSGEIQNLFDVFSDRKKWFHLAKNKKSVSDFSKVGEVFDKVFGEKKMSDASIPLKIVATDYETGEARVFTKEDDIKVKDALLCSISIPGVFPHVHIDNNTYIDGFFSSNLPIEFSSFYFLSSIKIPNRKIMAVNVMGSDSWKIRESNESGIFFLGTVKNFIFELENSMYVMNYNFTKYKLSGVRNIVLMEPKMIDVGLFHTKGWEKLVDNGYEEAKKKLQ